MAPRDPPAAASVRDSEVIVSVDAGLISQTLETTAKYHTGDDFDNSGGLHSEIISKSEVIASITKDIQEVIDSAYLEPQVVTVAAECVAGFGPP